MEPFFTDPPASHPVCPRSPLPPEPPSLFIPALHNVHSASLRFPSSATVPFGTQWSVYDPLGWFCGPGPGSGSGTGFLSLKGSQGFATGRSYFSWRDLFSCFFCDPFSNPLKSTFGAHLVLNWCQNDPKSEPVWVLGSIKKTILCKKTRKLKSTHYLLHFKHVDPSKNTSILMTKII